MRLRWTEERGSSTIHGGRTIVPVARTVTIRARLVPVGWSYTGPARVEVDGQRHPVVDWVLVARLASVLALVVALVPRRS
ncbi:MAG: hypothetical protein R3290_05490 [Acidimicrobiia bacterium]|nr:hypothetical protein [Acidimicrobiia bacterium]